MFLGLLLASCCFAQQNLSISQAIEIGLRNNYQIGIAEKNKGIAQNNNNFENAGRYPTIDLNVNLSTDLADQKTPTLFLQDIAYLNNGLSASIDVNWILFDGYKVNINKKRLDELEKESAGNGRLVVEQTIQQIILAYHQALIEQEYLETLKEVLDLSDDRVTFQKRRKDYGLAVEFDVIQSQDAFLNDSINVMIQENTYETALRNLNLAMGIDNMSKKYTLSDELEIDRISGYNYEDLRRKMMTTNFQLQNLLIRQKLANVERRFQESNRYPQIGLGTGLIGGVSAFNPFGEDPSGRPYDSARGNKVHFYFNLSAKYNLYDAGNRKRGIQNAKLGEEIAQLTIDDFKRKLTMQLKNTLETYNNRRALLSVSNRLVSNASKSLGIAKSKFKAGQISSFDYRAVQLSYVNASQSRLKAVFNLKNTETELSRITGGLIR